MKRVASLPAKPLNFIAASILGTLFLVPPAPPAQASVFGTDQRAPLPQTMRDAGSKIGVFFDVRSHSVCTAFCLAPDVVATAAHCLYRTKGEKPLRLSDLSFKLHGTTESVRIAGAGSGAPEANVISGSTRLNVHPPIDATRDWAVVRLAAAGLQGGRLHRQPQVRHRGDEALRQGPGVQHRLSPRSAEVGADAEYRLRCAARFRRRRLEHDPARLHRPRPAAAAHLRHGRRLVRLSPPRRGRRPARRSSASTSVPTCSRR